MAVPISKGKEKMAEGDSRPKVLGCRHQGTNNPTQPTCTCMDEYIQDNFLHHAFQTFTTSLRGRFQENELRVSEACHDILHQHTSNEMAGREAFDRLNCILVNEADFFRQATKVFALYMSAKEHLKSQMEIQAMDMPTVHKILDFYGL